MCVCACVRACVRACVHARVCACACLKNGQTGRDKDTHTHTCTTSMSQHEEGKVTTCDVKGKKRGGTGCHATPPACHNTQRIATSKCSRIKHVFDSYPE